MSCLHTYIGLGFGVGCCNPGSVVSGCYSWYSSSAESWLPWCREGQQFSLTPPPPPGTLVSWNRACYFRISNTSEQLIVYGCHGNKRGLSTICTKYKYRRERCLESNRQQSVAWHKGTFEENGRSNIFLCKWTGLLSLLCLSSTMSLTLQQALGSGWLSFLSHLFPICSWYEHSFLVMHGNICANALTVGHYSGSTKQQQNPATSAASPSKSQPCLAQLQLLIMQVT